MGFFAKPPPPSCQLTPQSTLEDWLESARQEFVMCRTATAILNMDDKELEKYGRNLGGEEIEQIHAVLDLCDWLQAWHERYKAAADTTEKAGMRLLVIAERLHGRANTEKVYAN